ncbi:MAG: hypothetical protein AAGF07_04215 [Patescibacteria group bacterium]
MIGFYDSGIGGIGVLEEVLKIRPSLSFSYLADFYSLPLGNKSIDYIQNRTKKACEFLFSKGCKIVILACNTSSVNSIRHIQQVWLKNRFPNKKVLGVTKPLIEKVTCSKSQLTNKPGLLLSTTATYNSGFYQYEFSKIGLTNLTAIPCPGLAKAIENSDFQLVDSLLVKYIRENRIGSKEIQYVILACTHYRLALNYIKDQFQLAEIIDASKYCAERILNYIKKYPIYYHQNNLQQYYFTVSNNSTQYKKIQSRLVANQRLDAVYL